MEVAERIANLPLGSRCRYWFVRVIASQVALSNAPVQLQARYNHCGVAASEKCLSAAMFVRRRVTMKVD
jgi:hypothetical protein